MPDDVRRWSDELARDPGSMVFLQLGEALRRQGQVDLAFKVAVRGLERRPHNADAHDLLARIYVDQGDLERAFDEWDMVLRLAPGHAGALKGMGFVYFRQGQLELASRFLGEAAQTDGDDPSIAAALELVRRRQQGVDVAEESELPAEAPVEEERSIDAIVAASRAPRVSREIAGDARTVFADVVGEGSRTALLLDASGLVLAGAYPGANGEDLAERIGAELSGVSDEARRAMRHLGLGEWSSIVFETEGATVAMAPAPSDALLVIATDRATPLGFVRRLLDRAGERARRWLGEGA